MKQSSNKRTPWLRWLLYAVLGLLFGVADYYFEKTTHATWLAYAFFLIPAIPMAAIEFCLSNSRIKTAITDALVWCVAIVTFYLYQMVELIFIGKPGREGDHISHAGAPWWRGNVLSVFKGEVLSGIAEWLPVALAGGFIGGICVSFAVTVLRKLHKKSKHTHEGA